MRNAHAHFGCNSFHSNNRKMDAERLSSDLDTLGSCGVVLSVEQRTQLQSSLIILKNKCKFKRVQLWGVIRGINADYFVAAGLGSDELTSRKYLYSQDCKEWCQLAEAERSLRDKCGQLQGRLTGRPEHIHEQQVVERMEEGEKSIVTVEVQEVDRLAALVATIQQECAVVPKGAFMQSQDGTIVRNKSFGGISPAEAVRCNFYHHFSPSQASYVGNDVQQLYLYQATINKDSPAESWGITIEQGGETVFLKNLFWPGHVAYHKPNTPTFGNFYSGSGEKTGDLLFML